ncbi:2'-deoxynucleoside 5'-phosphate N-hydrolase 1 [Perognathus longimembris pacificus]|uniref:2'-deoxynucleoside 5'-phosphate N-hydrolase 1 n=1 Tax=Perognathus longimembris pacificus TaxID=214514 RepID=UPI00201861EC|nr:2'-deoxynucleoside 5'-phosphate N-hydrolase 1 [Perognathus longimembris pacificus]
MPPVTGDLRVEALGPAGLAGAPGLGSGQRGVVRAAPGGGSAASSRAPPPPGPAALRSGHRAVTWAAMAAAAAAGAPRGPRLYFCGSIRGGRADRALYGRIVRRLRRFGAVLTEHVAAAGLGEHGEEDAGGDGHIHARDMAWLQQADVVVAEVTQPSLGVGYELGRAVALQKKILCLFRPRSGRVLSAMIRGAADGSRFQVWDYEEEEVEATLDRYFEADPPVPVAIQ